MKKTYIFLIFSVLSVFAVGQTYNMSNTAVTTCSGTFYDSQGTSDYLISESFTKTFTPATAGNMLRFNFTTFSTESCCDYLRIYDGPTTASPLIGQYQGATSPGTITATNATGQLTFQWYSDGSVIGTGWVATISCVPPPTYNMSNTDITTCNGTYYDENGPAANYDGSDFTQTFTPATVGFTLQFNFTSFITYDASDFLIIYDGPDNTYPVIGTYFGGSSPGLITATNSTGQLTFDWTASSSNHQAGWVASISCVPFPPPANDDCAGATSLTVGTSCSYQTYTNTSATGSSGAPAPGCASYVDDDVWFKVVVPPCGRLIFDTDDGDITDGGMAIYSGACNSLTLIDCDDDGSVNGAMPMIDQGGLTPGSTIYIRFWEYGGDVNGTFGICVYDPETPCSGTPSPGATAASPSSGVCSGDAVLLSTSQTAVCGLTYQWQSSPDNVAWSNISGATTLTTTVNPTATTWYRLRVTCSYSSLSGTSTPVQVVVATTTSTCANATVIASLPYAASGLTTCCMGNDYVSGDACTSIYMNGEDYMFTYTPAANTTIDISLTGTLSYTGVFVTRRCPDAGGATCIASATSSSGNPQLCGVTLSGGTTYYIMVDTYPSPDCTPFNISITSSSAPSCGLNYTASTMTYGLSNMTGATNINIVIDDVYAPAYTPLGFNFCYDGMGYSQCLVSSNGYLIFDPVACATNQPSSNASPSGSSDYSIDASVPNAADGPRNCIMFPWQDTDPNDGGTIRYKLFGVAPNRIFVLEYLNVRYFDDTDCPTQLHSAQVKLFETTNNVEIHIDQKDLCTNWNEGAAVLGLHNYNGTIAVIPSGYNYPDQWTANNQAWRFTCNCVGCLTLPVEYLEFAGEHNKGINQLNWTTASETNNDYFSVEKLLGEEYIEIGQVNGAGNSNKALNYRFDDNELTSDISYYRLKQVDYNGEFKFSPVISVSAFEQKKARIYPNPAHEIINVDFFQDYDFVNIEIINAYGQKILTKDRQAVSDQTLSLDISPLPGGMYVILLSNDKGVISTERISIR